MAKISSSTDARFAPARVRHFSFAALLTSCIFLVFGCGKANDASFMTGGGSGGNASGSALVSFTIKDAPPTGITVSSAELTITGLSVTSASGSTTVISSSNPVTVELGNLRADSAFLASANLPAATYTSMNVSVTNFSVTFMNNSGSTVTLSGVTCLNNTPCQVSSSVSANIPISTSPFPLTVSANLPVVVALDFNLNTILDSTLTPNFSNGVTASATAIPLNNTALIPIGNLFGEVTATDGAHSNFTVTDSQGAHKINFDANTVFRDFPSSNCSTQGSACLAVNQAVVVNSKFKNDGSVLATSVTFEDKIVTEPLVEGEIVFVKSSTQFQMVVFGEVSPGSSLAPGTIATVTTSPTTTFSIDDDGTNATAFSFVAPANLIAGQVVQVKALSASSGTSLLADRVRLRDTELTVTVQTPGSPNFTVNGLPPIFTTASIIQFQVQTSSGTELGGTMQSTTQLTANQSVSLRGQLFRTGSNSVVMSASLVVGN